MSAQSQKPTETASPNPAPSKELDASKSKPAKPSVTWADMAPGCMFGGFFLTMALLDVSCDMYYLSNGQLGMLAAHYFWKGAAPILMYLNLGLTVVLLPLGLYTGIKEGYIFLFTRRASFKRHFIDFISITTLLCVVYLGFGFVAGKEGELAHTWTIPYDVKGHPDAAALAQYLLPRHIALAVGNLILLLLPFAKLEPEPKPKIE